MLPIIVIFTLLIIDNYLEASCPDLNIFPDALQKYIHEENNLKAYKQALKYFTMPDKRSPKKPTEMELLVLPIYVVKIRSINKTDKLKL